MPFVEILKILAAIIASLGGVSVIILGISNWLGKIWADRLLESYRTSQAQKLEEMRSELTKQNQLSLEAERAKYARDIEEFKAALSSAVNESSAENKARRDYEYEARKRLYRECEPYLFRLAEASEHALHRIFSISRTARNGDLGPYKSSWLQSPGYYMSSTIYNLLSPLVVFRLLQEKITFVDLTVDQRINDLYLIAKWLKISFTEDFVMANEGKSYTYKPYEKEWQVKRTQQPQIYWRQGVTLGRLDVAIEGMIKSMKDGTEGCMNFGEFESIFYKDLDNHAPTFGALVDVFLNFHPEQRPVLWRILVLQAHLHAKLMRKFIEDGASSFFTDVPIDFKSDWSKLDWGHNRDSQSSDIIIEPILTANNYLRRRLPHIVQN